MFFVSSQSGRCDGLLIIDYYLARMTSVNARRGKMARALKISRCICNAANHPSIMNGALLHVRQAASLLQVFGGRPFEKQRQAGSLPDRSKELLAYARHR